MYAGIRQENHAAIWFFAFVKKKATVASLFLFLIIRYSAKAGETFAKPRVQKLLQQSAKVGGGLHLYFDKNSKPLIM